ncbi:hypothetical protein [Enterococcus sp. LJL51]|uniref:hypothetical protein n=1 Tax=Enterococcus sp. LJL51 TaxID=3416656 RepID=UPI003CE8016E
MDETVSTDGGAVLKFNKDVLNALSNIEFKPTNGIHTSTSPATDELKELMSSFQEILYTYRNCLAVEVKNVQAVHITIETTDKLLKDGIASSIQT